MKRIHPIKALLVSLCLTLTACGFQPLYGVRSNTGVVEQFADIRIATIADREGQQLRNLLIDRLHARGEAAAPQYDLVVTVTETQIDLGIQTDATATRGQLQVRAQFQLVGRATGAVLIRSMANSTTSYNILESEFTTLVTSRDARLRALTEIADNITRRLAVHFR